MKTRQIAFLALVTWITHAAAHNTNGFDLVTMKNGDYHHGTAAKETYSIDTGHGTVTVPYGQMQRLELNAQDGRHVLTSRTGDSFAGKLVDGEIRMLRSAQPMLPLDTRDVGTVGFGRKSLRSSRRRPPDAVELADGSRFSGRINLNALLIKSKTAIRIVNRGEIHLIDIASLDDADGPILQIVLNGGEILSGDTTLASVPIDTRYGQTVDVPLGKITTLAFGVGHGTSHDFRFRRRHDPAALLQDELLAGGLGPEMLALRGGRFTRGDLRGDGDVDESPPTEVSLKPFALSIYETTFEEYDRFCEETRREKPDDQGWGRGRQPVINVTWLDAVAYSEWLSRKTRKRYRLPTDAEWEYAARGGTTTRFWWGNETQLARANCEGCGSLWDGERISRVGKFPPNPFGLHDTAGNVFEWTADCFSDSFADAPKDGGAIEKKGCGKRVIRGGAWSFPAKEIRSANRWRDFPSRRSDDTGFRIARDLD